jgi:hypothetical protein
MQKLLHRFFVVSGLAVLGLAGSANTSYAGTATLNASQDINAVCNFTNSNYTNSSGTISSDTLSGLPIAINWQGTVGVNCNHGGQVVITASEPTVSATVTAARGLSTYTGEYLSIDGTNIWKNGTYTAEASAILTPSTSIPYAISITTTPGSTGIGLPNGSYNYTFTLTATPN